MILPESLTSIGDYAFDGCDNLTSVRSKREYPPVCGADVFYIALLSDCTLYVPKGCMENYSSVSPWSEFGQIVEFERDEDGIFEVVEMVGDGSVVYDLNGNRVARAGKGNVYIVGGKKAVVR